MKLYDINGELVHVDIRPSTKPVKFQSKSKLQGVVGEYLEAKYPRDNVLEDFVIPGSRLSLDFFLPKRLLAIEVDGKQHSNYTPFFHGPLSTSGGYGKQISRDREKENWCEINNITLVRIVNEIDLNKIQR